MSIVSFNLSGFGLDITDRNLKLVQATPVQNKYRLQAWGEIRLKPGIIDNGEIVDQAKVLEAAHKLRENLNGKLTSELAVASLPETKTFLKLFKIGKPDEEEKDQNSLVAGIESELPKQIPLPVENIIYDYSLVRETQTFWEVLVGAVPKEVVTDYTSLIKAMGFSPLALEIEAQAISRALVYEKKHKLQPSAKGRGRFLNFNKIPPGGKPQPSNKKIKSRSGESQKKAVILADLGASRSSLIAFNETIHFTRSLELSGNDLTKEISIKLGLSAAKAEQAKIVCGLDERKCKGEVAPIMKSWVDELASELRATIDYYVSMEGLDSELVGEILLCGGSASLMGLPEVLAKKVGITVKAGNPWIKFVEPNKKMAPIPNKSLLGFSTAIGLAIR